MIENLTDYQSDQLSVYSDRWTAIGLSCEPIDFPRAQRAVRQAYAAAKLDAPAHWVTCDGPLSAAIVASILRDSVWDSVGDSVWAQMYGCHDAPWIAFYCYFRELANE